VVRLTAFLPAITLAITADGNMKTAEPCRATLALGTSIPHLLAHKLREPPAGLHSISSTDLHI